MATQKPNSLMLSYIVLAILY